MAVIGITGQGVPPDLQGRLRCAITSGAFASPGELARQASGWAAAGVDVIQLREPALLAGDLLRAATAILAALDEARSPAKLLVNSRADVAVAARAHGVHLTSRPGELTAVQVRSLYASASLPRPVVGISCHTLEDVRCAREQEVDLILFGPVFEKRVHGELVREGSGLDRLRAACEAAGQVPVLALGGVTPGNAGECLAAGASGIAGIRLFSRQR